MIFSQASAAIQVKPLKAFVVLGILLYLSPLRAPAQSLTLREFQNEAVPQWNQVRHAIDRVTLCRTKVRDYSPKDRGPMRVDEEMRKSPGRFLQVYDNPNGGDFFLVRDLQAIKGQRKMRDAPWSISELNDFASKDELDKQHAVDFQYSGSPLLSAISADFGVFLEDFFNRQDFNWDSIVRENNLVTVKCSWVDVDQNKGKPLGGFTYDRVTFVFDATKNYQWVKRIGTWGKEPPVLVEQYEVVAWTPFENLSLPQTLTTSREHNPAFGNNPRIHLQCSMDIEYSTKPNSEEDFSLSRFGIPEIAPRKAGFKSIYLVALMMVVGAAIVVWRFRGNLGMTRAS